MISIDVFVLICVIMSAALITLGCVAWCAESDKRAAQRESRVFEGERNEARYNLALNTDETRRYLHESLRAEHVLCTLSEVKGSPLIKGPRGWFIKPRGKK